MVEEMASKWLIANPMISSGRLVSCVPTHE
jgi:hypothetical protein